MSLANGRPYLAIPGPSVLPDRVLNAMHRASPNIYAGELVDLTASIWPDLRAVAGTRDHVALYIGNGHASWEAVNCNLFSPGDEVILLVTGRFGVGWGENARGLGLRTTIVDFGDQATLDLTRVEEALRASPDAKAVFVTHVDTATGVKNDLKAVRDCVDRLGHQALVLADCIASLGCDEIRMDDWGVDAILAASQKGLMCPPGLSFVFFSERARERGRDAALRTPYWDWEARITAPIYFQHFYGTAPTHHLFALREALDMLGEETLPHVWARHETLARAVWAASEAWGRDGAFRLNITDPKHRSHAVTAMSLSGNDGDRLRAWCETQAGVTLGIGIGRTPPDDPNAGAHFRLAHMGHINAHMTLGALAVMDAGLKALDIPHGSGALEAAARVVAGL